MQKTIKQIFATIIIFMIFIPCKGQIIESFSNGNFEERWTGDINNFFVTTPHTTGNGSLSAVTDGYVLGSKPNIGNSSLFIETGLAYGQWNFSLADGQGWIISSQNDYFIILSSDTDNPEMYKGTLNFNGYYLRFDGSANHNFILYRQQGTIKTVVINTNFPEGNDISTSEPRSFRITRTVAGLWSVYINNGWDKNATVLRGTATDNTFTNGNFFGLVTNIRNPSETRVIWFDNLYAGAIIPDTVPPKITDALATTQNQILVSFSKTVESNTALDTKNYLLETIGEPQTAIFIDSDNDKIKLEYPENFQLYKPLGLYVSNVRDLSNNKMRDTSITITWAPTQPGDIIINEIYFEQGGNDKLPLYDFLELHNTRNYSINLNKWKLTIGSRNITFPDYTISAKGFVILSPSAAAEQYSEYGEVLGIIAVNDLTNPSSPPFKEVTLCDTDDRIIHTVSYNRNFYRDPNKITGGWSLELIDTDGWCQQESNWKASIDPSGATPGRKNSVFAENIDTKPPKISSAWIDTSQIIIVLFDERITNSSATNPLNYDFSVTDGIEKIKFDSIAGTTVNLYLNFSMKEGDSYNLKISNISDLCNNILKDTVLMIDYVFHQFGDIVFNEIMCNPNETTEIPNVPYLELYNRSDRTINLYSWKLISGNTSYTFPAITIDANDFLIIKPLNATQTIQTEAPETGLFASNFLTTSGKMLELHSNNGDVIHWVNYSSSWYANETKRQTGGWSIEQIDPSNLCAGSKNWKASEDTKGGTPGQPNSIKSDNPDILIPELKYFTVENNTTVAFHFNKSINYLPLFDITEWKVVPNDAIIKKVINNSVAGDMILVEFINPLRYNTTYKITPPTVLDFVGNTLEIDCKEFMLPELPFKNDIVINEILFNPNTGGCEFVELYNCTSNFFSMNTLNVTRYGNSGDFDAIRKVSDFGHLIYPKDYLVLARSRQQISQFYPKADTLKIVETSSLPSLPNSSGNIVFMNLSGEIIDEFWYSDKMHSPLIRNVRGVALERINHKAKTQDATNWHSAAETDNFATPGYSNSQHKELSEIETKFKLSPEIFSPDNDGFDDFLYIEYKLNEPGYIMNVHIFDVHGRLVIILTNNHIAGTTGNLRWDGIDSQNRRVPIGPYLIVIEYFDTQGNTYLEKLVCTVARK